MGRVNRLCIDPESLSDDDHICRGAHKPYLPAGCPFYMLRADTEEYHLDWSREDLSRWTVARVMALCSAPPLAAETDTTETETATDTSDKMLLDTVDFALGSIIDRMSEFDTLPCSYAESLDPASARNSLEQVSPAIESTCPVRAAELVEDSRPPLSVETTQPSPPPVPTTSVDSSPLPLRSTPSVQNASGSGAVYVTLKARSDRGPEC